MDPNASDNRECFFSVKWTNIQLMSNPGDLNFKAAYSAKNIDSVWVIKSYSQLMEEESDRLVLCSKKRAVCKIPTLSDFHI